MKTIMKLTGAIVAVSIFALALSTSAFAQETEVDATMKAESEMESALGTVPTMFEVYPEHLRGAAWEWFKATQSPDATVPGKYTQLISLAVSAQIPCAYCVYAHTKMAKAAGATDEEIQEAVASAAEVRHWSTVLNGNAVELEAFKAEWDQIMAHMEQQKMAEGAGGQ
ncbi:MAG TPA: carboxymuconolactone decarboxylase family protein [Rhodothermales bacterium]|nr:carboxymuconolactone decarboxylase family protein [Rhodothermales bacterium]